MIFNAMTEILNIIVPTFFAIFVGYMVGKLSKIDMSPLVDITLYIGVPALTFVSLLSRQIVLLDAAKIWVSSLMIMLGCGLAAWLVFKLFKQKHSGLYVPIAAMNTINIPFPVIFLAYGAEGLVPATLFYIPNAILIYSLGVFIMAGKHWKHNVKEMLKLPVVYAAALGLIFNLMSVKVPALVFDSLDFISKFAIPLVLIVLGHNLSRARITSFPTTLLACFLRMGVGLALGFAAVALLNITGVFRSVVILDSAMPAAAASAILAAKYQNESEMVSSVVFLTTLVSLVSIPFLLNMLG
jgi:malate permease and related proteins